jgi:hypothetical protein
MFKNGGILLKKRTDPSNVDNNSIILFLNEVNELCFKDDLGIVHKLDCDLEESICKNFVKKNEDSLIESKVTFNKDVLIKGQLVVNAGIYEIVTKKVNSDTNIIELNCKSEIEDAGISVNIGNGAYSNILWKNDVKKWYINDDELLGKSSITSIVEENNSLNISTNTFFGDGSDGHIELNDVFELDRDYYFKNIRLNVGSNIKTNGYRVFVSECLTFNGGVITNDGNCPSSMIIDTNNYFIGGLNGTETPSGTLGQSSPGGRGASGGTRDGLNASSQNITLPINNGGNGGDGGSGGNGSMGFGGKSTPGKSSSNCKIRNVYLALQASRGSHLIHGGLGGSGGAGGAGDNMYYGGGGGGGGSGGGVIQIIAKNIILTPNASQPSISANGGNGENGKDAINGNCGGGGGGGSGGGGFVQVFCIKSSNDIIKNFIVVNSGIPGNGGKGVGEGLNGENGIPGSKGIIEVINVKTGEWKTA